MSYSTMKAALEAIKEALRYLVISFIVESGTILVQTLQSGINPQTGAVAINWSVVEAVALFSLLTVVGRAVDKFKHVYSKIGNTDNSGRSLGVLPF